MADMAKVCRIHVHEHPNADALQLGAVQGFQVVCGMDTQDGELGVFFNSELKLSTEFCEANDLYPRYNENGTRIGGGFFDPRNSRVRVQRFRGERSEGFWCPISYLAFTGFPVETLEEGVEFDSLNDIKICEKFVNQATLRALKQRTGARRENRCFAQHVDTPQLKYKLNEISMDDNIHITLKVHGTSARIARVIETTELPRKWWQKLLRKKPQEVSEYKYLNGTRRVIMRDRTAETGYYGNEQFRWDIYDRIVEGGLHKGEVIYGEILGYLTDGRPIMEQTAKDVPELKEVRKQYGDNIIYSYGAPVGTTKFLVYRITNVNEDGVAYDLPWPKVKERCRQLDLKPVPEIGEYQNVTLRDFDTGDLDEEKTRENFSNYIDTLLEGADPMDPRHPREGVVVRTDGTTTNFYKSKSFTFKMLEGIIKSSEEYVDMEEVA